MNIISCLPAKSSLAIAANSSSKRVHLKHSTKVTHRRATAAAAKHKVTRRSLANNHARSLRAAHKTQRRSLKDKPRLRAFNDKYFDAGAEEIGTGQQGKPQQSHTTSVHGGKPRVVPPSRVALYRDSLFGRPSTAHSFTQEASGETILHPFLKYGSTYSTDEDIAALLSSHPLIEHLDDMRNAMTGYDFGWIRETDTKWASRRAVCQTRSRAMMAALLHYDLDVSALIRYLGNNYTGEYRLPNISAVANTLTKYNIPQYLINQSSGSWFKVAPPTSLPTLRATTHSNTGEEETTLLSTPTSTV